MTMDKKSNTYRSATRSDSQPVTRTSKPFTADRAGPDQRRELRIKLQSYDYAALESVVSNIANGAKAALESVAIKPLAKSNNVVVVYMPAEKTLYNIDRSGFIYGRSVHQLWARMRTCVIIIAIENKEQLSIIQNKHLSHITIGDNVSIKMFLVDKKNVKNQKGEVKSKENVKLNH